MKTCFTLTNEHNINMIYWTVLTWKNYQEFLFRVIKYILLISKLPQKKKKTNTQNEISERTLRFKSFVNCAK
jgi:hypothetical protein